MPSLSTPRPRPPQHTPNPFASLIAPQQDEREQQPEPQTPAATAPPPAWPDISGFAAADADAAVRGWPQPNTGSGAWLTRSLVSRRSRRDNFSRDGNRGPTLPPWLELTSGSRGPERPPPPTSSSPPRPRAAEKPAALYLSATSTSLLPSDFYRMAPQSEHVHFWTTRNSLRAVLQARHPITHQPLGHYTLIFDSAAAAAAYLDAARRLHLRSAEPGVLGLPTARVPRATLPFRVRKVGLATPSWGRRQLPGGDGGPGGGSTSSSDDRGPSATPGGHAQDDFLASWPEFLGHAFDVRSFTLAPPGVPLTMRVRPLAEPGSDTSADSGLDLDLDAATLYGDDGSAHFARSSPSNNSNKTNPSPGPDAWTRAPGFEWGRTLGGELSRAVRNRDFEVTQVLCSFDDVGGDTAGGLTRRGVTLPSVGRLIDLDGRGRNLTWRLRPSDAVLPVRSDVAGSRPGALGAADVSIEDIEAALASGVDLTGDLLRYSSARQRPDEDEEDDADAFFGPKDEPRYKRYLLSFQDAAEAKRFAREWHKRKVLVKGEVWRVNATALW